MFIMFGLGLGFAWEIDGFCVLLGLQRTNVFQATIWLFARYSLAAELGCPVESL